MLTKSITKQGKLDRLVFTVNVFVCDGVRLTMRTDELIVEGCWCPRTNYSCDNRTRGGTLKL